MQPLVQLLLTVAMYSVMGATVGLGVVFYKKYPQIGFFMQQRPVLGWTLAFMAGSFVVTVTITVIEYASLLLLSYMR